MSRKPIQIIKNNTGMLTVLCDDGSIWYQFWCIETDRNEWIRDTDVPQDEEVKK